MIPVVTVDGPSGAGKGTICRLIANATGFHMLDSGALYRLTALSGLRAGIDIGNEASASAIAEKLDISFVAEQGKTVIFLAGEDVSKAVRHEGTAMGASQVAAHPKVRRALLQKQRDFRVPPGLVADGRDMGTVVFPDAEIKIFLTASAQERAKRRVKQLNEAGFYADFEKVLSDIQKRDEQDQSRVSAPLKAAEDAEVLDSTSMSIDEVFEHIMQKINRLKNSSEQ